MILNANDNKIVLRKWVNFIKSRKDYIAGEWQLGLFEYAKQTDSINCGVICLKFLESFKDKEKGPQMCMTCNYDDDSLIKYMGYLLDVLNKHSKTVSIPAHQHSALLFL